LSIPITKDLAERIKRKLDELEKSLEGREIWAGYPLVCETNREIGEEIEAWTKTELESLFQDQRDIQAFAEDLAEIHRQISGAREVRVRADARSIYLEVEGCTNFQRCGIRGQSGRLYGCLADMIVAGILQRALKTPVKMELGGGPHSCSKRFSPAWLADVLGDLDKVGAEGIVVLYKDRVLFSHLPTGEGAEALSDSILFNEENPADTDSLEVRHLEIHNTKMVLMRLGDIFVSVCLQPGASEEMVREKVIHVIRQAVQAL